MKKRNVVCAVLSAIMAISIPASLTYAENETITVSFDSNNGDEIFTIEAEPNEVLHELPVPDIDGTQIFEGWYKDAECTEEFVITQPIEAEITLYAKWSDITIPFNDVSDTYRFVNGVKYVYFNEIMYGLENDKFGPDDTLTRGMIVTILHRMEGTPVVNYAMTFGDVKADEYYAEAVRWAQSEKIVSGMTETEFAPNENVTREQLAAILYRYAKAGGIDIEKAGEDTNTLSYDDVFDTAEYAKTAMHYCLASEVLCERANNRIEPSQAATRGETANAVYKLSKLGRKTTPDFDYTQLVGEYQDTVSQRAMLSLSAGENDSAKITVSWSSSAFETSEWTMTAIYDSGKLSYSDCVLKEITYKDDNTSDEKIIYENGEGYFTVSDSGLMWDGAKDENCIDCIFEKEIVGIKNPMTKADAQSISDTLGLSFKVPQDADNVKYFIINNEMAQMQFMYNETEITARILPSADFCDISGLYYDWDVTDLCSVFGKDGKVMRQIGEDKTVDLCLWYDAAAGLMYSVCAEAKDLDGFDIQAIAEQVYVPAQGNVE